MTEKKVDFRELEEWVLLGEVGTDTARLWICSPESLSTDNLKHENDTPNPTNRDEFSKWLFEDVKNPDGLGDWGKAGTDGVVVSTGGWDGGYDVYARIDNGQVAEVRIVFLEENGNPPWFNKANPGF